MKKYIIYLILSLSICSCTKFLNINPKGEIFNIKMFSNSSGYEDAIYGIYSEAGSSQYLFAGDLIWIPECLAHNYDGSRDFHFSEIEDHFLDGDGLNLEIGAMWAATYKCINHINNIIEQSESKRAKDIKNINIYRGEMLAMRAFMHFQLLSLLRAPYYAPESLKKEAIPYVDSYSFKIKKILSVDEVYNKILKDLLEAEKLLSKDNLPDYRTNISNGFFSCRITHFNLYAVQAFIARVYWTLNQLDKAAIYAQKVIDSKKFRFRPVSAFVQADNGTIDMNETIFGLYSINSQINNAKKFHYSQTNLDLGFYLYNDWRDRYTDIDSRKGDYRINAWFEDSENGTRLKKVVNANFRGENATSYTGKSILAVNLFRLPELYFILCYKYLKDNNLDKASLLFNQYLESRGLEATSPNSSEVNIKHIALELRKEYIGEGLYWIDMKRRKANIETKNNGILDGNDPRNYMLIIPKDEFDGRKKLQ